MLLMRKWEKKKKKLKKNKLKNLKKKKKKKKNETSSPSLSKRKKKKNKKKEGQKGGSQLQLLQLPQLPQLQLQLQLQLHLRNPHKERILRPNFPKPFQLKRKEPLQGTLPRNPGNQHLSTPLFLHLAPTPVLGSWQFLVKFWKRLLKY